MTKRSGLTACLFGIVLLASGCGGSGTGTYLGAGGAGSGGTPGSGGTWSSGGPGPLTTSVCGRQSCSANLTAARSLLEAGDYAGAFEQYACADSPEAAFGAGLMRALLILDGENAAALLADFGETPVPATDLFGSSGILSREAARWEGQGSLSVTGGKTLALAFDRAQQRVPDDVALDGYSYFNAADWTSSAHADLSISFASPALPTDVVPSGTTLAVSFNCGAVYPTRTIDPRLSYVDLSFDIDGDNHYCSLPYFSDAAGCEPDGGSVLVNSAPTVPGETASYTLQNLLLSCNPPNDPAAPDIEPPSYLVRVSGTVSATGVSSTIDTTGLHPVFGADYVLNRIPAEKTGTDLIQHAGAAAGELEEVACFFAHAAQGSGTIFTIPGVLLGGGDLPITKGDAQLLAGGALTLAAGAKLARAHDLAMPLNQLVCDEEGSTTPCPTDQEYVDLFNQGLAAGFRPEGFADARALLAEALPLFDAGLTNVDATSLFVKNPASSQGFGMLREVVVALNQSLSGSTALPHVTPEIIVNLGAFFANPRDPSSLSVEPMLYTEECDVDFCTYSTGLADGFLEEYFAGSIDADWAGTHEWDDEDALTDATEEAAFSVSRHFALGL